MDLDELWTDLDGCGADFRRIWDGFCKDFDTFDGFGCILNGSRWISDGFVRILMDFGRIFTDLGMDLDRFERIRTDFGRIRMELG